MAHETLETVKLLHDTLKHLTTLSTGSIVVMGTFLEKFFKFPSWPALVPVIFLGFVVSIVTCVVAMAALAFSAEQYKDVPKDLFGGFVWGAFLGIVSFLIGVVALAIFSLKNF